MKPMEKIAENKSIWRKNLGNFFWNFSLIFFFSIALNYDLRQSRVLWYGSILFLVVSYFICFQGLPKKLGEYSIWLLAFTLLGGISILWCNSATLVIDVIKTFIVWFVVLFFVQASLKDVKHIESVLRAYQIAVLIEAIYILINVDVSEIGSVQIGTHMMEGWNGNGIGISMVGGAMLSLYFLLKTKKIQRVFNIAVMSLFIYIILYTGSRTALIMMLFGIMVYITLRYPKKMLRNIFVSIVILAAVYYLIMNVESLYNIIGVRIESAISLAFGDSSKADSSAVLRNTFIVNGIEWFTERPILGYGLNNYRYLNGIATGRATYAHNTFIELAVDLGIIGLILYYGYYIRLIVGMFKKTQRSQLSCIILAILVANLLGQYGDVNYHELFQNLIFCISFAMISQSNKIKD